MKERVKVPIHTGLAALFLGFALPAAAAPIKWTGMVDGVKRTALVEPGKDASTTPSPLVLYFRGYGGSASEGVSLGLQRAWAEATIVYAQGLHYTVPNGVSGGTRWQASPGEDQDRGLRSVEAPIQD